MAIIVEDGTIVTGANSYVTTAELDTFVSERDITLSGNHTNEQLLILAMDYIESLSYKGAKLNYTQPLQWPRVDVFIDGYYNNINNIPTILKLGLMQAAVAIDSDYSPQQIIPRKTVMEKVGDIEVQYSESSSTGPTDPKVMGFLSKLLGGGSGGANTLGNKG